MSQGGLNLEGLFDAWFREIVQPLCGGGVHVGPPKEKSQSGGGTHIGPPHGKK